jgi:hypothetical protein
MSGAAFQRAEAKKALPSLADGGDRVVHCKQWVIKMKAISSPSDRFLSWIMAGGYHKLCFLYAFVVKSYPSAEVAYPTTPLLIFILLWGLVETKSR